MKRFALLALLLAQEEVKPLWSDGPFSADGAEAERLLVAEDGTLSLASDWSKFLKPVDPSKWHVCTDLRVFKGRLYGSCCYDFETEWMLSPWAYSDGTQFCAYDPDTDEWSIAYETKQSMTVFGMREIGGRLVAPDFFPFTANRLFWFDGKDWSETRTLPGEMLHGIDVLGWKDKLYVSGSWRTGKQTEAMNDPNWYGGYGKVYESADGGKTWKEIHSTAENGRIFDMVVFQDRLWANSRGIELIAWDGKTWTEHPVKIKGMSEGARPALGSGELMAFNDRILMVNTALVYTFDGKTWDSYMPGYIDVFRAGDTLYGLRDDGHVSSSTDGLKWTRVTKEPVPKEEFERLAKMGRPLRRGSVALHRGRLVVGTGATSNIYMTPFHEKGSITLAPKKLDVPRGGFFDFKAAVPEGTHLKVQLRTAKTLDELKKASWRGPEGAGSAYDKPGPLSPIGKDHVWLQLRVQMESDKERRRSPVFKSAALIAGK